VNVHGGADFFASGVALYAQGIGLQQIPMAAFGRPLDECKLAAQQLTPGVDS